MLSALWQYKGNDDITINFEESDSLFYIRGHKTDPNWILAASHTGEIGFVPINHVAINPNRDHAAIKDFLDLAIKNAKNCQKSTVDDLLKLRQEAMSKPFTVTHRISHLERFVKEQGTYGSQEGLEGSTTDANCGESQEGRSEQIGFEDFKTPRDHDYEDYSEEKQNDALSNSVPQTARDSISHSIMSNMSAPANIYSYASLPSGKGKKSSELNRTATIRRIKNRISEDTLMRVMEHENSIRKDNQEAFPSAGGDFKDGEYSKQDFTWERNMDRLSNMNDSGDERACSTVNKIVWAVQSSTGLNMSQSEQAVRVVLDHLSYNFSATELPETISSLSSLLKSKHPSLKADTKRILHYFEKISNLRKSPVPWNKTDILDLLKSLFEFLGGLNDTDSCIQALAQDRYFWVQNMIMMYHTIDANDTTLRCAFLYTLKLIATLDETAANILLHSSLPITLGPQIHREIISGHKKGLPEDFPIKAQLLAFLFSIGCRMPDAHYESIGKDFISFLIHELENSKDAMMTKEIFPLVVNYNLQFRENDENLVLRALLDHKTATKLTKKILETLSAGNNYLEAQNNKIIDASLKLLVDMVSAQMTAALVSVKNVEIKIAETIIHALDLLTQHSVPGNKRRTKYLELIFGLCKNTNYLKHLHKKEALMSCLMLVLLDTDPLASSDQKLVKELNKEYPILFQR